MHNYLTVEQLRRALEVRDLTDPAHGPHAIQALLAALVDALSRAWGTSPRYVRNPPIVAVRDNYDRLGYARGDVTRAERYTRYLSPTVMLRSHTSAEIPAILETYCGRSDVDELLVVPGLVYRRDAVDRQHVGEPHQVDLWRLRSSPHTSDDDLLDLIARVVGTVLPGAPWRATDAVHPYTVGGRQIDVRWAGEWLELAECGRIHPEVLRGSGLDPRQWSGLALGLGLDRALMLRKAIPDIRYLRAHAAQMLTLDPWQQVSPLPAARRDISIVVDQDEDEETLGDRVRASLPDVLDVIESVEVRARTDYAELPPAARDRLGIHPGQANLLVRLILRPIDRTLSASEANAIRNRIYRVLHRGPTMELI
ncbi:hypothetical protein ACFVMC_09125 [Nocardia sp. NPDC127579]|uniref:PheS-related mystery ligase SrmL n=1 Tax=Nocardia sp. NPDC127579 TaxID=3345402 RepID=UPI0036288B57